MNKHYVTIKCKQMRERSHVITFCLALKKEKTNAILLPQKNDNFGQETSKVPGTITTII